MVRSKARRPRRPRLEALERRNLLTAYINELHIDPLFGSVDTDQYVELRGEPGASLKQGTYLVVVEGDKSQNEGEIHSLFDLSGQTFGSNGFLVLLQKDHPYALHEGATALVSTEEGFSGLPGNIYSGIHGVRTRIDFVIGSNTFLLIDSPAAPELHADIDADDDGLVDAAGIAAGWTVLDSLSMLNGLGDSAAYGKVVFHPRDQDRFTAPPDASLIETADPVYAARVGDSTGWAPADWVAGNTQDLSNDGDRGYRLTHGVFSDPSNIAFAGRDLDHVGTHNFVGAVRGQIYQDANHNGQFDDGEPPAPGVFVFADSNGNGTIDPIETVVDPEDYHEAGLFTQPELTNVVPGVTFTVAHTDNLPIGFKLRPDQDARLATDQFIFAHEGIGFIPEIRKMRADFYNPASSVSIVAIGHSDQISTYGRIEAYDTEGNLLGFDVSQPLGDDQRQRITVALPEAEIAFAVLWSSEDEAERASPFGRFTDFRFVQPEVSAVTDADGRYTLNHLFPGDYTVVTPNQTFPAPVTFTENYRFDNGVLPNNSPVIVDQSFSIAENAAKNAEVGLLQAEDPDADPLRYEITGGADADVFRLIPTTGQIVVSDPGQLNFEQQDRFVINVGVSDSLGGIDSAEVVIELSDVNEPPVVQPATFDVPEDLTNGTVLGTVHAEDPDAGHAGFFLFELEGDVTGGLTVLPETGEIIATDAQKVLAHPDPVLELTALATDAEFAEGRASVSIILGELNRAPVVTVPEIEFPEGPAPDASLGTVSAVGPESDQTVTFELIGGSGFELFTVDAVTGEIFARPEADFNFEVFSTYTLAVKATDNGVPPQSTTDEVTITLTDVNDAPIVHLPEVVVPENAGDGTLLGSVFAEDEDVGQSVLFSIVGGTASQFVSIVPQTGELRIAGSPDFDFEQETRPTVLIQTQDNGGPPWRVTSELVIELSNVNEPPQIVTESLEIPESAAPQDAAAAVEIADSDEGDTHSFSILGGTGANLLTIDAGTGSISVHPDATLDHETLDEVTLVLRIADAGGLIDERTLTVKIGDVNEAPVVSGTIDPLELIGNQQFSMDLPPDLFVDPEGDNQLHYEVKLESGELLDWMQVDADGRLSGTPRPDFVGTFTLSLVASDNGATPASGRLSFEVTVAAAANPWHNGSNVADVDGDNEVKPLDALRVINFLTRFGVVDVLQNEQPRPGFLDVDGDNVIKPIDALRIINLLSQLGGFSGGEEQRSGAAAVVVSPAGVDALAAETPAASFDAASRLPVPDLPQPLSRSEDDHRDGTDVALEMVLAELEV